tara:strand:- start:1335 stop:2708 length:1374 start_codon:yes stop_codon:yes gene_type:complete
MAIKDYDKEMFGEKINRLLFPAQPVNSIEHLFGREKELGRIERALYAAGRHIFIFGDRGIGKSSLAATAANQYQSSDAEYIDVSCSPDSNFSDVIANIAYKAVNESRFSKRTYSESLGVNLRFLNYKNDRNVTLKEIHNEVRSLLDAVEILREVSLIYSKKTIVVVDEFDRMQDAKERALFADLLKHLGDKRVNIKFIFTGVSATINDLLGAHESAIRQLETIELSKMNWDARWHIVLNALDNFNIGIDREILIRIAAVSDGYPYYVHLITEKLMWHLFSKDENVDQVSKDDYHIALNDAIESISAELKLPYEKATLQRSTDFEKILWATADSEYLHRYIKDMYSSYKFVMKQFPDEPVLDKNQFGTKVRSLKKISHGEILLSDDSKSGLYVYKEKVLRGYVRMQAESHGVELIGEVEQEKVIQHATARASTGYFQSKIPEGVHQGRSRSLEKNGDE